MEDRLIKFARIVDAGSFTKAAAAMHISQPALTTAVKKLEKELQAELLIRSGHSIALTTAGQIAYQTAKQLTDYTRNMELRIKESSNQKSSLHVGMIDSLANLLFIEHGYFEELEQTTQLSLSVDNSSRLITSVEHDELDLAFVAKPIRLPSSLKAMAVCEEPLIFVTRTDKIDTVTEELRSGRLTHFLSYNQASRTFNIIQAHFAEQGIAVSPLFYSTSPEIMLQLVLAGRGSAVLPYPLVKPHLEQKALIAVSLTTSPVIRRTVIAVSRSNRALSMAAKTLMSRTTAYLQELNQQANRL